MVKLLQIVFIMSLFILSRVVIGKVIGKRARRFVLEKLKVSNKKYVNKTTKLDVLMFLGGFFLSLLSGYNIIFSIMIGIAFVGILYGIRNFKKNFIKKQILCDLLSISECLRVQLSSYISLSNALRTLPELCENKEFSNLLTNVYLEYELSKFVILDAGEELFNKFTYPEMRIFISALNQQIQGTSAIEAFDNLIAILRDKYIEFLEDSTKSKMAIMTMGVFIIVLNIATIGIYPVAIEAFNAINVMLK